MIFLSKHAYNRSEMYAIILTGFSKPQPRHLGFCPVGQNG
jgi:hypothetical protein